MKREQVLPLLMQVEGAIKEVVPTAEVAIISEFVFEFVGSTARDNLSDLCRKLYTKFPTVEAVTCNATAHYNCQTTYRIRLIWKCKDRPWED